MTAHPSLSDADVDAIEARASAGVFYAGGGVWETPLIEPADVLTLCAEVRRLRQIIAVLVTE